MANLKHLTTKFGGFTPLELRVRIPVWECDVFCLNDAVLETVAPCSLVDIYRCIGDTAASISIPHSACCLSACSSTLKMEAVQFFETSTRLYGVTSQKIALLIVSAVVNSKFLYPDLSCKIDQNHF